ncbi:MAG: hypothetical protein ACOH2H_26520 [Cypionkella sp.]
MWELVLFRKLDITAFRWISVGTASGIVGPDDPSKGLAIDGVIVSLTIVSYVLANDWRAWVKE